MGIWDAVEHMELEPSPDFVRACMALCTLMVRCNKRAVVIVGGTMGGKSTVMRVAADAIEFAAGES